MPQLKHRQPYDLISLLRMLCNDPLDVEVKMEKNFVRRIGVGGSLGCGNGYKCLFRDHYKDCFAFQFHHVLRCEVVHGDKLSFFHHTCSLL